MSVCEFNHNHMTESELAAILGGVSSGICAYRIEDGKILPVFHNEAFYEVMGYSEENIARVNREMSFVGVHPEDVEALRKKIAAVMDDGLPISHCFRVFNDRLGEYRWIGAQCSARPQADGQRIFYVVYNDMTERIELENDLISAKERIQYIVNAIPGGVAIYKLSDIPEAVYFSDGVPELTGYTVEEFREIVNQDAMIMTYSEDREMVGARVAEAVRTKGVTQFECRRQHRNGDVVWVRARVRYMGEEDGCPLVHCVFHNITDLKEMRLEMDHLVNFIPGGIASYRVEGVRFVPIFFSDGVARLSGHSREEYEEFLEGNALNIIYELDRDRVARAAHEAFISGEVLDVSYRIRHKDGRLLWIHLNGRRMGPLSGATKFYAVFTGMSSEALMFQDIANESDDGIYVIDADNYDLLYANESKNLFGSGGDRVGRKCYAAMHGKSGPCEFCTLKSGAPDGEEREMKIGEKVYSVHYRLTDWNGIRAYVKHVREITAEAKSRQEKLRLEEYFQTVLKKLPVGIAVIRYKEDGHMTPEFLSEGFSAIMNMSVEETWDLYRNDATAGLCPEDGARVAAGIADFLNSQASQTVLTYRLMQGNGDYAWVKATMAKIRQEDNEWRFYVIYNDITSELTEQERIRKEYNDLILQHYRAPDPAALILGHCNVTKNVIVEIADRTGAELLKSFGRNREEFFTGVSRLVVDEGEAEAFRNTYLNAPVLDSFKKGETERVMDCFIKLPAELCGRYVRFKVNLVSLPDTGDVMGMLTASDVTEKIMSEKALHQVSVSNYDYVADLDLNRDLYNVLVRNEDAAHVPNMRGSLSRHVAHMLEKYVLQKDRAAYESALRPENIRRRLEEHGAYTFSCSVTDKQGEIKIKNITVSPVDLRIGRVCIVRTDITESFREQRRLLNMTAHTSELAGFINIATGEFTTHTRRTMLENLAPTVDERYETAVARFVERYGGDGSPAEKEKQFSLDNLLRRLEEKPSGYSFVYPCAEECGLRYKQISVLWGDEDHTTVCMMWNDVTDMLAAEQEAKNALEKARKAAEQASRAKSRFLSNMSHDIRTPMNAIIGMTQLAETHMDDPQQLRKCLKSIGQSGQLLVSLINDVLDLSKIESGKMTLKNKEASLEALLSDLVSVIQPSVSAKGQHMEVKLNNIIHETLQFDTLRMNQMLLNLLSNAVKFTPDGGAISLEITESPAEDEGFAHFTFSVSDNGIGMRPEFLEHVFDSFVREKDSRINKVEGSGLGLAITKMIVDMMEGTIKVQSELDKGSVFTVDVNLRLPENPPEEEPLPPLRVLVVENDRADSRAAERLLACCGVCADTAQDGRAAVEKALTAHKEGNGYDLILLAWQLSGMDGIETAAALRCGLGEGPAIVIAASYYMREKYAEAEKAGVNGFISKPFLKSALLRCIRQHVLHTAQEQRNSGGLELSGRKILAAEDNQLNQCIVENFLSESGVEVEMVENGQVCVDRFAASAPGEFDLILMDVHMPIMNGYEATRRIRAMARSDAGIPILAMTADAFTEDVEMAEQSGMNGHLSKPLNMQHMLEEIKRHLK